MKLSTVADAHRWPTLKLAHAPLYGRLLKLRIVDPPLLGIIGVVAGLRAGLDDPRRPLAMIALVTLGLVMVYIVHVMDDLTGLATGTDRRTAPRKAALGEPKVLVSGEVSVSEARVLLALLVVVAILAAIPVVWMAPPGLLLAMAIGTVFVSQYSAGARLSYHGLGELAIVIGFGFCPIAPYVFLTQRASVPILWLGLLAGVSTVLINFSSNLVDQQEDASSGRRTLVVILGRRRAQFVVAGIALAFWVAYLTLWGTKTLPPLTAMVALIMPLHARLIEYSFSGHDEEARRTAFRANRLHALLLTVALLLAHETI